MIPRRTRTPLNAHLALLLLAQVRVMDRNIQGVINGRYGALHDWRVAMRRFRTLLRAFRKPLSGTSAAELDQRLSRFSRTAGPVRDMEEWVHFLQRRSIRHYFRDPRNRTVCIEAGKKMLEKNRQPLTRLLQGPYWRETHRKLMLFIRKEISRLPYGRHLSLRKIARHRLDGAMEDMEEKAAPHRITHMEGLHALRKACRTVRYLAEGFLLILDRPAARLARRMKKAQDRLGDIHDLDIRMEHTRHRMDPASSRTLLREMRAARERMLARALKSIPTLLTDPGLEEARFQ